MLKVKVAGLALGLWAAGLVAAGAENSGASDWATMDEVVVTATRQEERAATVPANVTVITAAQIRNATAADIPDLLRSQAGIHVNDITGNRRNYTVDLRGFGETAALNTLVMVDGRRINQADLSGTDWWLIPLERVERIEVVRGGRGSVLYGDNAAGGVINIITREGREAQATAGVVGGSYGAFQSSAAVGGTRGDLTVALSAGYADADGYRDNSQTRSRDVGFKVGYWSGETLRWHLSGGFHDDSAGLPGAIKQSDFTAGVGRTDTLYPEDFADTEDAYLQGGSEFFFGADSLFKVDVSWRQRNFFSFSSFDAGFFRGDTDIETLAAAPQLILKEPLFGFDNRLTVGLDASRAEERISNDSVFFGFPDSKRYTLEKQNTAVYVHDEFRPVEGLALSAGYRYDRATFSFTPSTPAETTMDADLFTAGVSYAATDRTTVYLSYARSFRYPVLDELFSFFTNTINPGLQPQTSDDYEVGVKYRFSGPGYAALNLFQIDTRSEIVYNPNSFANENLDGTVRRKGVEVSAGTVVERLSLSAAYTYTEAQVRSGAFAGKDFPNVPTHKASVNVRYDLAAGFAGVLNGVYMGERPFISDFDNTFLDQDDYFVLNAKVMYSWKKIDAFLTVNNVFDEQYAEYGGVSTFPLIETGSYPSPGINYVLGVSTTF